MPNLIQGTYTIKEVMNFTKQSKFNTRFDYQKRDKVKVIRVRSITFYDKDRKDAPLRKYSIITQSSPNYKPYVRKGFKTQRRIKHEYECELQMDRLSLNTVNWRGRVGKLKKISKAPQQQVKTVYRETMANWKKQYKNKPGLLKRRIASHKRNARYESDGDWQAQVKGINLDFIYRAMYAYKIHGHLYQKGGYIEARKSKLNPNNIVFFPKHMISLIEALMIRGILKND